MNLFKKFNFYDNAKYFLFADAIIFALSIIITSIFGFNLVEGTQSGAILLNGFLTVLISFVFVLIYVGIRYDFAKAFSLILIITHNILLTLSLISIIRIPLSSSILMSIILAVGLTTIFTLILTEKIVDIDLKKADFSQEINTSIKKSIKEITIIAAIAIAFFLILFLIPSANLLELIRPMLVVLFVIIYSSIFIALPIWCYFAVRIKRVKRTQNSKRVEIANESEEETVKEEN